MTAQTIYQSDLDELIFQNKNKEYGAYKLRKAYKASLSIAMWIAVLIATSGFTLYRVLNTTEIIIEKTKPPIEITLVAPPPIGKEKPIEPVEPLRPLNSTIKFTPPVVKPDLDVIENESIPTIEQLSNVDPGTITQEGTPGGYTVLDSEPGNENILPPKTETIIYHIVAEEMPDPIGGTAAILKLIKYPEIAIRAGIEGKVLVLAFVDENGNVNNAKIIQGIGGGCDEAAIDAVLKTKFKPGRQQGNPVKVQVSVPVVYKLHQR